MQAGEKDEAQWDDEGGQWWCLAKIIEEDYWLIALNELHEIIAINLLNCK